ncbi:MAG TPA: hypothetical protein VE978_09545 [Chitinophagales bacterium]|nr:hypothetical protein [Chitinophagales bacterium]
MKNLITLIFTSVSALSFGQNVVYHETGSLLPEIINVQGTIIDISPGYCGTFCIGGVTKVKLDKTISNFYSDSCVYLVTACLSLDVKKNTVINVTATKLTRYDTDCYYRSISNSFDSNGTPFYKLSEEETNKINAIK